MLVAPEGLDGVDDDQVEGFSLKPVQDVAHRRLRRQTHRRGPQTHPRGAGADLVHRLFAGNVDAVRPPGGGGGDHLQQQGRFADARIAAEQDGRSGRDTAATDPVELHEAGKNAVGPDGMALQGFKRKTACLGAAGGGDGARLARLDLLDQRVPGLTRRALAGPFGMDRATRLADVGGAVAGHGTPDGRLGL